MRADRQTDIHEDTLITIPHTPTGKVIMLSIISAIHITVIVIQCRLAAILLGRIAAIAAYCYRRSSAVCVCLSVSVCHVREPCKNG